MRLVCPNCKANYEIPRDAVPISGREVNATAVDTHGFKLVLKKLTTKN